MEQKSTELAKTGSVKLTKAILDAPATLSEMMSLPQIEERWIQVYEKTSGKNDGAMRFEAEKVLFSQAVAANKALDKCDRFTLYAAFIELAISQLTLRDGLSYILPYGKVAQWMPGWKGRLEQICEMQDVIYVHEPVVVYDCDVFEDANGMNGWQVVKHTVTRPRPAGAQITLVYMIIQFTHGAKAYKMEAEDVIHIRDTYSSSYKSYAKALLSPKNKGKVFGDKLIVSFKDKETGAWKDFESEELPMWVSDVPQAYKKTLVKRTYNSLPKLPKHKALDARVSDFMGANPDAQGIDPDETPTAEAMQEIISEHITDEVHLDKETGELINNEEEEASYVIVEEEVVEEPEPAAKVVAATKPKPTPVVVDDLNNPTLGF